MDWQAIIKLGEVFGPHILLFIIFKIYLDKQFELYKQQYTSQERMQERYFEQTQDTLGVLQTLVAQGSRMETKIDSNRFCPIVRQGSAS